MINSKIDISGLENYIVNEFIDILNKLECGEEVKYEKIMNALSLYNIMNANDLDFENCKVKSIFSNIHYYLSYYK